MRLGTVVDGESEYYALPDLCRSIRNVCAYEFAGFTLAKSSPKAPLGVLAKEAVSKARVLISDRGADEILYVVDFEDRDGCPGAFARQLTTELAGRCGVPTWVVVKVSMFENWLVADPNAIQVQSARFNLSDASEKRIVPNKADHVDALEILRRAAVKDAYSKVKDGKKILARADPLVMASNSRSFRRFLRVVKHPSYASQSAKPA